MASKAAIAQMELTARDQIADALDRLSAITGVERVTAPPGGWQQPAYRQAVEWRALAETLTAITDVIAGIVVEQDARDGDASNWSGFDAQATEIEAVPLAERLTVETPDGDELTVELDAGETVTVEVGGDEFVFTADSAPLTADELDGMTKAELLSIATLAGLSVTSKDTKQAIIDAILSADAEA